MGYGFLAFGLTLAILFFLRAKGLLKRKRFISKFLVVTYWIFIPIIAGAAVTGLKGLSYAHHLSLEAANAAIDKFEEKTYPTFHNYITENVEKYLGETVLPTNEEIAENFVDETDESGWITELVVHAFLDEAEDQAKKALDENYHISGEQYDAVRLFNTGSIDAVYKSSFEQLKSTTHTWLNTIFRPYYWMIGVWWFVLMIFPVTEIIVVAKMRKKRTSEVQSAENIADL